MNIRSIHFETVFVRIFSFCIVFSSGGFSYPEFLGSKKPHSYGVINTGGNGPGLCFPYISLYLMGFLSSFVPFFVSTFDDTVVYSLYIGMFIVLSDYFLLFFILCA